MATRDGPDAAPHLSAGSAARGRRDPWAVLEWLPAILALAIGAWVVATSARMVVECWSPVPFLDQWEQTVSGRPLGLRWLFSQHNEHRLAFPRLVFLADAWLARETNKVNLAAGFLLLCGLAAAVAALSRGVVPSRAASRAWAVGLAASCLLWSAQWENLTWGFQVQFFLVLLAAVAAFSAVALRPATPAGTALAAGLGFVAAYSLASGILVPFLVALLAAWLGRPWRHVALLAAAAAGTALSYLAGYRTPPTHSDPLTALSHLGTVLAYVPAELGGPFEYAVNVLTGRFDTGIGIAAGAVGLAGLAALLPGLHRRRKDASGHACVLAATCLFVVGMCLLTGIGRARFGLSSALASRYATPAMLFWTALAIIAVGRAAAGRGVAVAPMLLSVPVLLLVAGSQTRFAALARGVEASKAAAIPALLSGVSDEVLLSAVFPVPGTSLRVAAGLRAAEASVFAPPRTRWLGSQLQEHASIAAPGRCKGSLDAASPVGAGTDAAGWRVRGRLAVPGARQDQRHILVLVDAQEVVAGYGISSFGMTDTDELPIPPGPGRDWVGALRGGPEGAAAYVLLDDGTACRLDGTPARLHPAQVVSAVRPAGTDRGGAVDSVLVAQAVELSGWAFTQVDVPQARLGIDTNLPVLSLTTVTKLRPDVAAAYKDPRLAASGFLVRLVPDPTEPRPARLRVCVWSDDPLFGRRRLAIAGAAGAPYDLCGDGGAR